MVLLRLGAPQGSAQWWEPALLSSERGALPAMVPPSCCQPWRGSRTNFRSPAWVGAQAGAALLPPEHPIPSQSVAPVPSRAISPPYQGPSPQAGWEQRLQAERPLQQKWESGLREGCRTGRLSSPRAPPELPPFPGARGLFRPPAALSQGVQSTQNAYCRKGSGFGTHLWLLMQAQLRTCTPAAKPSPASPGTPRCSSQHRGPRPWERTQHGLSWLRAGPARGAAPEACQGPAGGTDRRRGHGQTAGASSTQTAG